MDRYERITVLHRLLKSARTAVPMSKLMHELHCSRSTVYRLIAFLRDALMAPVVGDSEAGFSYAPQESERFELPGVWLSSSELHALLAAQQLLARTGDGLLSEAMAPLQQRIEALLNEQRGGKPWPLERVRVIQHRIRRLDEFVFRAVATAVLERKQLRFEYHARTTNQDTRRWISPQRLTHYRDNWYLDAWDHDREALRSFSVDRIQKIQLLVDVAVDVPDEQLNQHFSGSYGIFAGEPKNWATIVFSAKAARWVADERWHSKQQGRFLPDGRYELKLPYSNGRELLMDVLHYGADAVITAPVSLREQARLLLGLARTNYDNQANDTTEI